jgi:hypothetical protein
MSKKEVEVVKQATALTQDPPLQGHEIEELRHEAVFGDTTKKLERR